MGGGKQSRPRPGLGFQAHTKPPKITRFGYVLLRRRVLLSPMQRCRRQGQLPLSPLVSEETEAAACVPRPFRNHPARRPVLQPVRLRGLGGLLQRSRGAATLDALPPLPALSPPPSGCLRSPGRPLLSSGCWALSVHLGPQ